MALGDIPGNNDVANAKVADQEKRRLAMAQQSDRERMRQNTREFKKAITPNVYDAPLDLATPAEKQQSRVKANSQHFERNPLSTPAPFPQPGRMGILAGANDLTDRASDVWGQPQYSSPGTLPPVPHTAPTAAPAVQAAAAQQAPLPTPAAPAPSQPQADSQQSQGAPAPAPAPAQAPQGIVESSPNLGIARPYKPGGGTINVIPSQQPAQANPYMSAALAAPPQQGNAGGGRVIGVPTTINRYSDAADVFAARFNNARTDADRSYNQRDREIANQNAYRMGMLANGFDRNQITREGQQLNADQANSLNDFRYAQLGQQADQFDANNTLQNQLATNTLADSESARKAQGYQNQAAELQLAQQQRIADLQKIVATSQDPYAVAQAQQALYAMNTPLNDRYQKVKQTTMQNGMPVENETFIDLTQLPSGGRVQTNTRADAQGQAWSTEQIYTDQRTGERRRFTGYDRNGNPMFEELGGK